MVKVILLQGRGNAASVVIGEKFKTAYYSFEGNADIRK
ncbi:hypothetical protein A359_00110 [secondary endosymbiont of Ctenarytaina eucalypti]|uniref:Uncharacterized protein n=1 Tax=secondary endosymbiont of Ctenarytaina eucalypti TaxID=1199245 RepID=J3TWR3_9ENTR|nr:hypothetical protein A359_00110 [secondary endosymbiont of Ctenarytaina eucalypti]